MDTDIIAKTIEGLIPLFIYAVVSAIAMIFLMRQFKKALTKLIVICIFISGFVTFMHFYLLYIQYIASAT